jgi:hypothetical protein
MPNIICKKLVTIVMDKHGQFNVKNCCVHKIYTIDPRLIYICKGYYVFYRAIAPFQKVFLKILPKIIFGEE